MHLHRPVARFDAAVEQQSPMNQAKDVHVRGEHAAARRRSRVHELRENLRADAPLVFVLLREGLAHLSLDARVLLGQVSSQPPACHVEDLAQFLPEAPAEIGAAAGTDPVRIGGRTDADTGDAGLVWGSGCCHRTFSLSYFPASAAKFDRFHENPANSQAAQTPEQRILPDRRQEKTAIVRGLLLPASRNRFEALPPA